MKEGSSGNTKGLYVARKDGRKEGRTEGRKEVLYTKSFQQNTMKERKRKR